MYQVMTNRSSRSPDPDRAVVEACRRGDTDAFETLVKKYQTQMYNIALRTIGSPEEAEEAVQDAFVSAYKNIGKFKGTARFATWLTRIVINMSRNQITKRSAKKRKNTRVFSDVARTAPDQDKSEYDPASTLPSPVTRFEQKQAGRQVQYCLDKTEPDFREVLILKDREGFSYAEIGETLEIPLGTVKSRLFRARDMVRNCLENNFGE